ncbi:MAG: hypothetical protein JW982_09730 [Spirochaetes bacterium]|nr:hypothetical protein [Spirochaetota bacterium]
MNKFFRIIFTLFILAAVSAAAYYTVNIIEENEFAVEIDKKNKIVKKSYDSGIRIVYRAVDFKNVDVLRFPKKGVKEINARIFLPELADLKDDEYSISAGFEISYEIIPSDFIVEYDMINGDLVQDKLTSMVETEISRLVNSTFSAGYDAEKLANFIKVIDVESTDKIISASARYGIKIAGIKRSADLRYPSEQAYNSGLLYKTELNDLKKRQGIEIENLKHSISKMTIQEDYYFEKLKKMSSIIKENPLMLKYIYIDKIAPNVKMILPVGTSGYPLEIETRNSENPNKSGEIDNLK